jgi:hypothetical protein
MSAIDPVDGSFSATRVPGTWALLRLPRSSSSRQPEPIMFDKEARSKPLLPPSDWRRSHHRFMTLPPKTFNWLFSPCARFCWGRQDRLA